MFLRMAQGRWVNIRWCEDFYVECLDGEKFSVLASCIPEGPFIWRTDFSSKSEAQEWLDEQMKGDLFARIS